ncbi:pimeloyl-ACP methyl ester carboxylesterase [Streptomyces sp. SAI-170]|uniref:antibiotic ABC transporter ATP-binding protein n=1 Tax=Streptomyces sp. SAI-170 TaxID=3377729 RepID=UPI003C7A66EB
MSRIVMVHGIAQEFLGPEQLRRDLVPALQDGVQLSDAGMRVDPDDVSCAFYGDLYFEPGTRSIDLPPWDETDVEDDMEAELLAAWWETAARIDPGVPAPDEPGTRGIGAFAVSRALRYTWVRTALDALAASAFFGRVSDRMLIFALRQVRRYLTEPELRAAAVRRVAEQVGPDTKVLVGHSLGSVVAYETICAHPEWQPLDLVTVGSPLGLRGIVFDRLTPAPTDGLGAWPGRVRHWSNIADRGDIVALTDRLRDRFGDRVTDHTIDNGARMHDFARYLSAPKTGAAVARGLA